MDDRNYMILLYDFYGELFHEKQRLYFEEYYFQNLSLGEISDNLGVSRNAVHKVIQGVQEKLIFYEEKLHLCYKSDMIRGIINDIDDEKIRNRLRELI